jgi:hypothetical protein
LTGPEKGAYPSHTFAACLALSLALLAPPAPAFADDKKTILQFGELRMVVSQAEDASASPSQLQNRS